jgi:hypothetical protein
MEQECHQAWLSARNESSKREKAAKSEAKSGGQKTKGGRTLHPEAE